MEKKINNFEKILKEEGMPPEPDEIFPGKRVDFGDGLGRKNDAEEKMEDEGWHSSMCPLNLGASLDDSVDQPFSNRPEESVVSRED